MSASLDELNRFRAEMMQHISHEIRMPLQSILSAHYLLTKKAEEPVSEPQLKLLNGIRENVQKIANFSNQFLDLSKVEAGMMQYNVIPVDIADGRQADRRGREGPRGPEGDRDRLRRCGYAARAHRS